MRSIQEIEALLAALEAVKKDAQATVIKLEKEVIDGDHTNEWLVATGALELADKLIVVTKQFYHYKGKDAQ